MLKTNMDDQNQNPEIPTPSTDTQQQPGVINPEIQSPLNSPTPIEPQIQHNPYIQPIPNTQPQSSDYSVEAWLSKGLTFVGDVSHGRMVITNDSVNMLGDNGQTIVTFPIPALKKVKQYDRSFAFSSSSGKYFISVMDPKSFRNNQFLGAGSVYYWFVRKKLQSPVSMPEVRNALKSHGIKVQGQISTFAKVIIIVFVLLALFLGALYLIYNHTNALG